MFVCFFETHSFSELLLTRLKAVARDFYLLDPLVNIFFNLKCSGIFSLIENNLEKKIVSVCPFHSDGEPFVNLTEKTFISTKKKKF